MIMKDEPLVTEVRTRVRKTCVNLSKRTLYAEKTSI